MNEKQATRRIYRNGEYVGYINAGRPASARSGRPAPMRQAKQTTNDKGKKEMRPEKYFDGYNTIAVYEREHGFTLMKYYKDEYYCGDPKNLFSVRSGGDDIFANFHTLSEARKCFRFCVDTYLKCASSGRPCDTIDEILRTWRQAS